jgi:hypothetical protein
MSAAELLQRIRECGGTVELLPLGPSSPWHVPSGERQLKVTSVPRHLVPELRHLKADIIRTIEGENYRHLVQTFNLKRIRRGRLEEVEGAQRWRIASAQCDWTWKGARCRN